MPRRLGGGEGRKRRDQPVIVSERPFPRITSARLIYPLQLARPAATEAPSTRHTRVRITGTQSVVPTSSPSLYTAASFGTLSADSGLCLPIRDSVCRRFLSTEDVSSSAALSRGALVWPLSGTLRALCARRSLREPPSDETQRRNAATGLSISIPCPRNDKSQRSSLWAAALFPLRICPTHTPHYL